MGEKEEIQKLKKRVELLEAVMGGMDRFEMARVYRGELEEMARKYPRIRDRLGRIRRMKPKVKPKIPFIEA